MICLDMLILEIPLLGYGVMIFLVLSAIIAWVPDNGGLIKYISFLLLIILSFAIIVKVLFFGD